MRNGIRTDRAIADYETAMKMYRFHVLANHLPLSVVTETLTGLATLFSQQHDKQELCIFIFEESLLTCKRFCSSEHFFPRMNTWAMLMQLIAQKRLFFITLYMLCTEV